MTRRTKWGLTISVAFIVMIGLWFGLSTLGYHLTGIDHYNTGVHYHESGQHALAEQQFALALQQNPDLAEAHLNLGLIYLQKGWLDGAETRTRTAIDILERDQDTWVEGAVWTQTLSIAYGNLATVELKRSRRQQARAHFTHAIELDPTNAYAQANIKYTDPQ